MHSVVGCSDCGALWVVADDPETTGCPRCGTRHTFRKLKRLFESDDPDEAREARAALLAERAEQGEAFAAVDDFAALEESADEAVVDDRTHLEAAGIDADTVEDAGERAASGRATSAGGTGGSRREVVLAGVGALDEPTADDVADYCAERGVDPEAAREALEKLARAGEVSEHRGVYRRI